MGPSCWLAELLLEDLLNISLKSLFLSDMISKEQE